MFVSRLGWHDLSHDNEVLHVRGIAVAADVPPEAVRIRSWPNRLGILEQGGPTDRVAWIPDLAPRPPHGLIEVDDPTGSDQPESFDVRLKAFRKFVKGLGQLPGVEIPVVPEAMCTIVLTNGDAFHDEGGLTAAIPGVAPTPSRLEEFPGGVQLRVGESEWPRFDQYAQDVQQLLTRDQQP